MLGLAATGLPRAVGGSVGRGTIGGLTGVGGVGVGAGGCVVVQGRRGASAGCEGADERHPAAPGALSCARTTVRDAVVVT